MLATLGRDANTHQSVFWDVVEKVPLRYGTHHFKGIRKDVISLDENSE
jgi:hypothetical protein